MSTDLSNLTDGQLLKLAFDRLLEKEYGGAIAPDPYLTQFGVRTIDAILGGGLSSSTPVSISSTPETGKSTFCFQFCKSFLTQHPNSVAVYLDIETSAASSSDEGNTRIAIFNIDQDRIMYRPMVLDLKQTFSLIEMLVQTKQKLEDKKGQEVKVLFIIDSLAGLGSSKDVSADDPNQIIGLKARELTHLLSKYKPLIALNRITIIFIDQVRAKIKITSPYAVAEEKSTGTFNNFQSATNTFAFHHALRQWLYLSQGTFLKPNDSFGIDGWELHVKTEKNKLAPSKISVNCVFDKRNGIIPILSEYLFMRDMTKTEKSYTKNNAKKLEYPLLVHTEGHSKFLEVLNPETGELIKSDKFKEKDLIDKYNQDSEFKQLFDYALNISIDERIYKGMFRQNLKSKISNSESIVESDIEEPPSL